MLTKLWINLLDIVIKEIILYFLPKKKMNGSLKVFKKVEIFFKQILISLFI